jgi:hypothetical protein
MVVKECCSFWHIIVTVPVANFEEVLAYYRNGAGGEF